jgi:hypothetical protein
LTDRSQPSTCVSLRSNFFCDRSHLHKLCQPAQQGIFFSSSHFRAEVSGRQGTQNFFLLACPVASGQQSASAELFFFCPVASAQQSARAKLFFWAAQLFLLPTGLICAEPFDFLWRMESLLYTFSESCVRNLNFFGVFPSAVSGSLTALVRSS